MKKPILRSTAAMAAALLPLLLLRLSMGSYALYQWGSYHKKLRKGGFAA